MAELLRKNWFIFFVFISLLSFQLIYNFSFPSGGSSDNWRPITTYLPKFQEESPDSFLLAKIYPLISPEYRLNSDVGNYLELARNFSPAHFENNPYLNRPLYPFLILSLSLPFRIFTTPSYGIIFGSAIFLNFILINLATFLFFRFLKKIFSFKVAFLSSILLIFSPFVRSSLIQPLPEMLVAFTVVLSLYLLQNYLSRPSRSKLIIFSLIIGILLLGKMFYAISFFILLLAICFKRYREGIAFFAIHLTPFLLWYLWVTQVWQISYFMNEVQLWGMGTWLLNIFQWPWFESVNVFLGVLPKFIEALIYGFLLVPVFFSVIGFQRLPFRAKNLIYFGSIFSVLLLCFLMNLYLYRHVFLLFPIIYPTAILGIERVADSLKRYQPWYSPLLQTIVIGLIIFISSIDIYKVLVYLKS